jgi:hypothetical protein
MYAGKAAVTKSIRAFHTGAYISVFQSMAMPKTKWILTRLKPSPYTEDAVRQAFSRNFGSPRFFHRIAETLEAMSMTTMEIFSTIMAAVTEKRSHWCALVAIAPNNLRQKSTIETLLHVDETMDKHGAIRLYLIACSRSYGSEIAARWVPNPCWVATVTVDTQPIPNK